MRDAGLDQEAERHSIRGARKVAARGAAGVHTAEDGGRRCPGGASPIPLVVTVAVLHTALGGLEQGEVNIALVNLVLAAEQFGMRGNPQLVHAGEGVTLVLLDDLAGLDDRHQFIGQQSQDLGIQLGTQIGAVPAALVVALGVHHGVRSQTVFHDESDLVLAVGVDGGNGELDGLTILEDGGDLVTDGQDGSGIAVHNGFLDKNPVGVDLAGVDQLDGLRGLIEDDDIMGSATVGAENSAVLHK